MLCLKEIDMNRYANQAFATFAAFALTFSTIGAIVTVPPVEAPAPITKATLA